ncbi:RNA polymerase sigma-70 factor (ECF subfamily) [Saccharothrix carnea]|uniref:RNA polymerase sigma-70 factor (ECF subfamily) n=1 Tax=Saccharothrix carnea TaxID=1280637 RepID=A0A2P8I2M3_SACCR|nr:RNA polymerase sigma factor [Saccharothrix carnea]PSL52711.1 RNA polymerase sigma-70 factor (ECF subfamily) [Saccharothrix carnea]
MTTRPPTAEPVPQAESPPAVTDEHLLLESLATPERFAVIFDRYAPVVHGYLSRRVGTPADDLMSETFLLAFRGRTGYDPGRAPVRAWLFGIATNLVRRHARDEERRYRALGRAAGHAESTTDLGEVAGRVDAQALRGELAVALAALSREDLDVLLLWTYAQLSYAEIAAAVGVPVGTVRSRLHRARGKVRTQLTGHRPTTEETP